MTRFRSLALALLLLAAPAWAQQPDTPTLASGNTGGQPPTATTGGEGNYFLDYSTGNIFGPKSFGQWPAVAVGAGGGTNGNVAPGDVIVGGPGPNQVQGGSTVAGQALQASPQYFNLNAASLPHWRKVVANVRAGTGRGLIAFLGDSTTMGAGAGTTSTVNTAGAFPKSYPNDLTTLLNSKFVPALSNSLFSDQATPIAYGTYDVRVTLGANWSDAFSTPGGKMFRFTTGAVNNLTFTPGSAFDTIKLFYAVQPGNGSFTYNIDGGASLGTVSTAGATAFGVTQVSVTKGTHTINIIPNNDGTIFLCGIKTWDSTTPAIDVMQFGVYGGVALSFSGGVNPWESPFAFAQIAPDLSIVALTINDSNNGTALATYTTEMQTIITNLKLTGDVILVVGAPSNTAQATNGTLDTFISALVQLAITNNVPLINAKARWISYAFMNPIMPYFDNFHQFAPGYQDYAQMVDQALIGQN